MKIGHTEVSLVQLLLVYSCNMSCEYCYQDFTKDVGVKKMSIDTFCKILEMLKDKKIDLNLYGGEPLLNTEIISFMLSDAFSLPHNVEILSVNTNGVYMDDTFLKFTQKFYSKIHVDLSIDGNEDNHNYYRKTHGEQNTYASIVKNLEKFLDKSFFTINFCVSPYTSDKLFDGIVSLKKLGFKKIKVMFLYEKDWNHKDISNLLKEFLKLKRLKGFIDLNIFHQKKEIHNECKEDFMENHTFLPSGELIPCPVWISKKGSQIAGVQMVKFKNVEEKKGFVNQEIFGKRGLGDIIQEGAICENIQGIKFKKNKYQIESLLFKSFSH